MREWDSQDGGKDRYESKKRDILIEGAIMNLARKMALEKCPRTHMDDPS